MTPSAAPVDLWRLWTREPNASTVCVENIPCDATEEEILELFNSVGGVFGNREPNIVVGVNFVYANGNFQGQVYLLYSTIALADFVVDRMDDWELHPRRLQVRISDCRFDTGYLSRRGYSRLGSHIWECYNRPRPQLLG